MDRDTSVEFTDGGWNGIPDDAGGEQPQLPETTTKEPIEIPAEETHENLPARVDEPQTREELEAEADAEGRMEIAISEIQDKPEITLDDLRTLPGADDFSDDELLEIAINNGLTIKGHEVVPATRETKPAAAAAPKAYRIFGPSGKEATDLTKVSAASLLEKGRIQYRANNQDQLRTFPELIRLAQLGHHNEARLAQILADRGMLTNRLNAAGQEIARLNGIVNQWIAILADETGEEFLKAQGLYFQNLKSPAPAPAAPSAAEIEARGVTFYQQTIVPALRRIVDAYPSVKIEELDKVAQYLIAQEPLGAMTKEAAWERVKFIINEQLPAMIEASGHVKKDAAPEIVPSVNTKPGEVAPMTIVPAHGAKSPLEERNELLRLRAENANLRREQSKGRMRRAPGGARVPSGEGTPPKRSGTEGLEAALDGKSSADARDMLRSLR